MARIAVVPPVDTNSWLDISAAGLFAKHVLLNQLCLLVLRRPFEQGGRFFDGTYKADFGETDHFGLRQDCHNSNQ